MTAFVRLFRGTSLMQRAARTSVQTLFAYAGGQGLRLASNLILTRLLFPEAFGVMAMVTVIVSGLLQFSDLGSGPAIMQSKRGDDPDFLDTAWTIHIGRGVLLWLAACGLAWPAALYFGEPDLAKYLPVAAMSLILAGFNPTRMEQAGRHMQVGRVMAIELGAQTTGIVVAVGLAALTGSVWSLVASNLVAALAMLCGLTFFLPGHRNRLRLDRTATAELVHFGKWIFLSTVAGFAVHQADKLVLGKGLSTHDFGLYNIGYFLASFPLLLASTVARRIMIPLYRDSPPAASAENFARIARARFALTGAMAGASLLLAAIAPPLVTLLYDVRYASAGDVTALMAVMQVPAIIVITYDQAALAGGDSRRFFVLTAARAALMIAGLSLGFAAGGLFGALVGFGLAHLAAWPVVAWLARAHGAWDARHDLLGLACWLIAGAAILIWRWPQIGELRVLAP
ncbi:oligosaccharide flippase family protein [Pseudoroseicyclus tamaricis]|uniref:Oligosaccharide flippase family protein n=1 Tax=Pseudoroseicyclus tamaricis TaxID=2705421 RepID=A0A6B2JSB1_9RHOB|nr:oligosaccharide flippase family protein [Pseudoroseicyclus tamaricis]NDU99468.1 oligosaccharide flippase family protein [Pseudoroseicyclus tamaricis]